MHHGYMDLSDVIRTNRARLGLSQIELAKAAGLNVRQIARYEAGEQQPVLSVAVALADALDISLSQLAGQVSDELNLSGTWWATWETSKDGEPRIDTHSLEIAQRGERLHLDAERARAVAEGSYRWRGELRLWDNESLMGWYRSTDSAVRSKGTIYLALHPHGTHAWGRWVGLSYDGQVITGWAAMARDPALANDTVQNLINTEGASHGRTG